jgi:hypothetical protein
MIVWRIRALGYEVELRPAGVTSRIDLKGRGPGFRGVLAGIGHLAAHLSVPEAADRAIAASEDGEGFCCDEDGVVGHSVLL